MLKRIIFTSITVGFISLLVLAETASADLMNGDFSYEISSINDDNKWDITAGPVDWWKGTPPADPSITDSSINIPAALFRPDGSASNSTLIQMITVDPGFSLLSFDIFMTTEIPTESDTFTATLGTESLGFVDLYTLSSSALIGDGEATFAKTVTYDVSSFIDAGEVRLTFNLAHNNDLTDPVTTVLLDNVALVPVPSAVILGSLGLTFSGWLLKRRKMV